MTTKTFTGLLGHKNPVCTKCGVHCFSLYQGGKKDRVQEVFICKNCKTIYELPEKKKCEFTESIEKKTLQEWQTLAPLFEKAGISTAWTNLKSTKEERK